MRAFNKMRLTNHDKLKFSLENHAGKTLKTEEIFTIVTALYPDFKRGSNLPNDHTGAWSCLPCRESKNRIFKKVNNAYYYVIDHSLETDLYDDIEIIKSSNESETTKKTLIDARVGQGRYRQNLLEYWEEKCSVTELNLIELLKASHIKPWSKCLTNSEKLDKFNGLLLSPNLDSLFDRGLITFDVSGKILISKLVDFSECLKLGITDSLTINKSKLMKEHQKYLKYHRENLFRNDEVN